MYHPVSPIFSYVMTLIIYYSNVNKSQLENISLIPPFLRYDVEVYVNFPDTVISCRFSI